LLFRIARSNAESPLHGEEVMDRIEIGQLSADRAEREPFFRAPWTIVALCAGLIILFALQQLAGSDALIWRYGLRPATLAAGHWTTLVSSLFLHVSWAHVGMNTVVAFAVGPPVARVMGTDPRGAAAFFAFYLACGVIGSLGLVAMDPRDTAPVIGASGAVSGLLGAAIRLIEGRGRIGRILTPTVLGFTLVWGVVNYVFGAFGLTPGAIGIPVAWQAHMAGYLAGLLLFGPFARLAGRSGTAFTH